MSWDDLTSIENQLNSQLQSFDWEGAEATCQQLIQRLRQEPMPPKESAARKILGLLRSARQFALMSRVADAFLDELLPVTNAHVVATKDERDRSLPPRPLLASEAQANFQYLGERVQVKSVEWLSPVADLDASLLRLESVPKGAEPLPLCDQRVEMSDPAARKYIIGYPGGRDLEISLHDNQLVGCNDTKLHYRTPSEPGSSGSPVFEPDSWKVVALHHRGKEKMERLDAPSQTYQANEGIAALAIQKATEIGVRSPN